MEHDKPISPWQEWKIIEKIGEGSYGKVYKAQRTEQGRSFYSALKVIPIPSSRGELNSVRLELKDDYSVREYFKNIVDECIQEISTMEYFRGNSHIVSVEDFKVVEYLDEIGWDIYIRMEYLTGFLDYCTGRELTEREIIKLGINLCKALEYCSQLRIIHRDIKPENIFVSRFGDFKLGDFGIARELERSMGSMSRKGTFSYMAPEMYRGEAYDSSVDIYSLGIVLYKLMNRNRLPFMSLTKQLITYHDKQMALNQRMSGELLPPPVDASEELSEIILRACAFHVKERYQDPEMMREDLERLRRGEYIAGSPAKAVGGLAGGNAQTVTAKAESGAKADWSAQEAERDGQPGRKVDLEPGETKPLAVKDREPDNGAKDTEKEADLVLDHGEKEAEDEGQSRMEAWDQPEKPELDQLDWEEETEPKKKHGAWWVSLLLVIAAAGCVAAGFYLKQMYDSMQEARRAAYALEALEAHGSTSAQIDDFTTMIGEISDRVRLIVESLPDCEVTGSDGSLQKYWDSQGRLLKALLYPSYTDSGKYEEYYFWENQLCFVYIWDEDGEELLYYNEDGSLVRWIDTSGEVHDLELDNPDYAYHGEWFSQTAAELGGVKDNNGL